MKVSNHFSFTSQRERFRFLLQDSFPVFATDSTAKCLEPDYTTQTKVKNFYTDIRKKLPPNVVVRLKNKADQKVVPQIFFAFFKDKLNEQKGTRTSLRWHYNIYSHKGDTVVELWFANYMFCTQDTVVLSRDQKTVYFTIEDNSYFFDTLVDLVVAITAHFRGLHFRNRNDCILYTDEYRDLKELRINRKVFADPNVFCYFHYNYDSYNNTEIDNWLDQYNEETNNSEYFKNYDREGEEAVRLGTEMIKKQSEADDIFVC